MEAGNRCKDECLPEETNRRIVDIISDVNLAYSEHARRYLHECGLPKERTYVTGSPMAEVLHNNLDDIKAKQEALQQKFYAISEKLYKEAAAAQGAAGDPNAANGSADGDNVYEADFKDATDDNK
jgi:UDP-N-acetylglucosamine 2-epimerase